jgi:hypothetical protein
VGTERSPGIGKGGASAGAEGEGQGLLWQGHCCVGCSNAAQERDKARAERDAVHAKMREARDVIRKGWDNLVMLVEEKRVAISEERGAMEYKIV